MYKTIAICKRFSKNRIIHSHLVNLKRTNLKLTQTKCWTSLIPSKLNKDANSNSWCSTKKTHKLYLILPSFWKPKSCETKRINLWMKINFISSYSPIQCLTSVSNDDLLSSSAQTHSLLLQLVYIYLFAKLPSLKSTSVS